MPAQMNLRPATLRRPLHVPGGGVSIVPADLRCLRRSEAHVRAVPDRETRGPGQVVQNSVETFIKPGLPVQHFVGFNQLADPMVKADPLIDAISFYDLAGPAHLQLGRGGGPAARRRRGIAPTRENGSCSASGLVAAGRPADRQPLRAGRHGRSLRAAREGRGARRGGLHPARQGGRRVRDRLRPLRPPFTRHGMSATGRWTCRGGFVAVSCWSRRSSSRRSSTSTPRARRRGPSRSPIASASDSTTFVAFNINLDEITASSASSATTSA